MFEPTRALNFMDKGIQDLSIIDKHLDELAEHFDSVQIFVTRYEPNQEGSTINIHKGIGNWFTRFGFVKSWVIRCEETERVNVRKED